MGTKKITHAEYLQSAFADFEQASAELRTFYSSLESRVAELTTALHVAQRAESEQRAQRFQLASRLSALLDALPAGVVELASDGTVAHFNPAAISLLGELQHGEQWSGVVERAFRPRWDDGHDVSLVDERRVNIDTAAMTGKAGQILLIKDVTETRRLQDRLSHHQRLSAKTEVAAALAHQIRTPLSSAILHLGALRQLGSTNEAVKTAHDKTLKGLRHIECLVRDMLMYSRDQKFTMDVLAVEDFMAQISSRVVPSNAKLTLQSAAAAAVPLCIRGNSDALLSVLQNLIDNAADAGATSIHISCDVDASMVTFCVQDNGPGVPQKICHEIFEPFVTNRANGNGLGLAIGRAICYAHGGDLILDSSTNNGSRFCVVLPILDSDFSEIAELKQAF